MYRQQALALSELRSTAVQRTVVNGFSLRSIINTIPQSRLTRLDSSLSQREPLVEIGHIHLSLAMTMIIRIIPCIRKSVCRGFLCYDHKCHKNHNCAQNQQVLTKSTKRKRKKKNKEKENDNEMRKEKISRSTFQHINTFST